MNKEKFLVQLIETAQATESFSVEQLSELWQKEEKERKAQILSTKLKIVS